MSTKYPCVIKPLTWKQDNSRYHGTIRAFTGWWMYEIAERTKGEFVLKFFRSGWEGTKYEQDYTSQQAAKDAAQEHWEGDEALGQFIEQYCGCGTKLTLTCTDIGCDANKPEQWK